MSGKDIQDLIPDNDDPMNDDDIDPMNEEYLMKDLVKGSSSNGSSFKETNNTRNRLIEEKDGDKFSLDYPKA